MVRVGSKRDLKRRMFDVRFPPPSKAALTVPKSDFRYTPESGLKTDIAPCPKSAKSGLTTAPKSEQSPRSLPVNGCSLFWDSCKSQSVVELLAQSWRCHEDVSRSRNTEAGVKLQELA